MNTISVIHPYLYDGIWVFDDEKVGLVQEPFVSGIDVMIDKIVGEFANPEAGFSILFSASPFPDSQIKLDWVREDLGGNWYNSVDLSMEGWLCPALYKYFDEAPPSLYIQCKEKR